MKEKINRINNIVSVLIFSDFFLQAGWGLITPIYAIFIVQNIQGGSLGTVGFAVATYWFVKSVTQPFLANFFDVVKGEQDDFKFLIIGMIIVNLIPLGYFFSSQIYHILFLEIIRGLGMAFITPSWLAIFSRHIDKRWYAFTWSIRSSSMGLAFAFAAAFGGVIATLLGFRVIFVLVSLLSLIGTLLLIKIRNRIFTEKHEFFYEQ